MMTRYAQVSERFFASLGTGWWRSGNLSLPSTSFESPVIFPVVAARKPSKTSPKRRSVSARTLTAYHEAGHAVMSASIANGPDHVTIRPDGHSLGRSGARMSVRPTTRVQVHLAGLAAEHVLTGRRSRELDRETGFAILARLDSALREAFADVRTGRVSGG